MTTASYLFTMLRSSKRPGTILAPWADKAARPSRSWDSSTIVRLAPSGKKREMAPCPALGSSVLSPNWMSAISTVSASMSPQTA